MPICLCSRPIYRTPYSYFNISLFKHFFTFKLFFSELPSFCLGPVTCVSNWTSPHVISFQLYSFIITGTLLQVFTFHNSLYSAALIRTFLLFFGLCIQPPCVIYYRVYYDFSSSACLILTSSVHSWMAILLSKKFLCLTVCFAFFLFYVLLLQAEDLLIFTGHLSLLLMSSIYLLTYYLTLRNKLILMDSHCSLLPCRWPLRGCEIKFFMQLSNEWTKGYKTSGLWRKHLVAYALGKWKWILLVIDTMKWISDRTVNNGELKIKQHVVEWSWFRLADLVEFKVKPSFV